MGSPPLWSLSCSLPLLLLLRPWLDPGGAPAFLLEAPTGSQSMPTAQPSTTLSTRLPTTSSRTTLLARSPGTVTLRPAPTTTSTLLEPWSLSTTRPVLTVSSRRPASRREQWRQGSPRPSSPPLDKPALSGLLLVRSPLTVLPLLFRQLAMDPACPVLVRTASPGQGAAPLTRATLSAL